MQTTACDQRSFRAVLCFTTTRTVSAIPQGFARFSGRQIPLTKYLAPTSRRGSLLRRRPDRKWSVSPVNVFTESRPANPWWKKDGEFWEVVENTEEFASVVQSAEHDLIFVDWFATWCHGCQKSAPKLTALAIDPALRKRVKFVKACTDGMTSFARREGARALPWIGLYSSEGKVLTGFSAAASKHESFRKNVETVLDNLDAAFVLDPNGYIIAVTKTKAMLEEEKKRKALEELRNFNKGFTSQLSSSPMARNVPKIGEMQTQPKSKLVSDTKPLPVSQEKVAFLHEHGKDYGYGGRIDHLYPKEVGCRMGAHEHYMDYTGSSVYSQSQLNAAFEELRSSMFGNPHSENPSSTLTQERIDEVRDIVLKFFNADPKEYQIIFTKSATAALKIVGETFPWSESSTFRYLRENHNSVLGIREYVLSRGGSFQSLDERLVEAWLSGQEEDTFAVENDNNAGLTFNLFAFPAEDNFAGVKYPLEWVQKVKEKSQHGSYWNVMLDAAAYVPTQPLDLSKVPADFVAISFYKMFGFPTGLGALIARVDAIDNLNKVFWAGGSVALATSKDNFHVLKCRPSDRLEDGTVAFLDIISLKHGFKMIENLGGIERIQSHVESLRSWLFTKLRNLRHSSGTQICRIFGKHTDPDPKQVQGSILNFEVLQPNGQSFSYKTFEREAASAGFHLRTGIECNPGAAYNYIGIDESDVQKLAGSKEGCDDEVEFVTVERPFNGGPKPVDSDQVLFALEGSDVGLAHPAAVAMEWVKVPLGSIRVSLGYMSTFEDCAELVAFIKSKYRDRVE